MRFSVITPTYNRASFLPETIESVATQDYENLEHIIVDDGSTDDTAAVLARYPHLIVVAQTNQGEPVAVNAGLRRASGDIIVVVNSDDPLRPGAVKAAAETFSRHPEAILAYPDWEETDSNGNVIKTKALPDDLDFECMLRKLWVPIGPAAFFRVEALKRVGLRRLDRKFTGDIELYMRIAAVGPIVHIPAALGTHRVHGAAAMTTSMGWRMSWEVAQLARDCLAMPHGSAAILADRKKIIANGHRVARLFCGNSRLADVYHRIRSLLADPKGAAVSCFRIVYSGSKNLVRRTILGWVDCSLSMITRNHDGQVGRPHRHSRATQEHRRMIALAKKIFRSLPKIRSLYAHIAALEARNAELLREPPAPDRVEMLEAQLSAARDAEQRAILALEAERRKMLCRTPA